MLLGVSSVVSNARAAYERGEYPTTVTLLQRALGSGLNDAGERATARLYLAAAYFAMGDANGADSVLGAFVQEAPAFKVDATLFPPPFVAKVEAVRAANQRRAETAPPVVEPVKRVEPPAPPAPPTVSSDGTAIRLRRWWWLPATSGVVLGGLGAGLLIKADADHRRLVRMPTSSSDVLSTTEAERVARDGTLAQSTGWAAMAIASAALVTALIFFLTGDSTSSTTPNRL